MTIQLAYTERGTGFPLILLHGNGESSAYFANQIVPLAQVRRVIAVDTRGHGASPRGSAPFTLSQFADDLLAFMDRLGIAQADMLGFSDGGNIALLFALRHPVRVRRMVVNGANLYPRGIALPALVLIWAVYTATACTAALLRRGRRTRDLFRLMVKEPHIPPAALAHLTMPVLVVAGTHDLIRARHTRRIATSLPDGRLVFLPGGHTVAQKDPDAFNRVVLAFLADEPSP
jgi:pimeloyl-ACP methyl ester carboxylesterase